MSISTGAEDLAATVARVAAVIGSNRYRYSDEHQLHDGIAQAFAAAGVTALAEARLSAADRIDSANRARRAGKSGRGISISRDNRPPRRSAGSSMSRRLVAPTTKMRLFLTRPSISCKN